MNNDRCTCPSGDGSLRWPCPEHPPAATTPGAAGTIERWSRDRAHGFMVQDDDGDYVLYESHIAAVAAAREEAGEAIKRHEATIARLREEIERTMKIVRGLEARLRAGPVVGEAAQADEFVPQYEKMTDHNGIDERAALRQPGALPDACAQMRALCSACGGTGDVTSIDGEWRGSCDCEASKAAADGQPANSKPGRKPVIACFGDSVCLPSAGIAYMLFAKGRQS